MSIKAIAARSKQRRAWREGGFVALLLLLATGFGFLLEERLSVASQAMVYVLAVVLASYTVGLYPGLACAVGAVTLLNFFFVPPRFTLDVDTPENMTALIAMLVVAVVISRLGVALRNEMRAARLSERQARQLQTLTLALAGAASHAEVRSIGQPFLDEADADSALPDARGRKHGRAIGLLLEQAQSRLSLADTVRAAEEEARWHRAQSTFLAGISHDFRTPLAAMVTAASSLQTQREKLAQGDQDRLTQVILDEAGHLAGLTENTLHLARLEHAGELHRDWQSMEEIVGSVLAQVRKRDPARRIRSRVAAGLPLVRADPVLLTHLLDNLLDNALKYGEGAIDLSVAAAGDGLEVAVEDRGSGIAAGDEQAIFEPYRRSDRSGQRGAGLGLAVCRAIATAHGAELAARPRPGGGSVFLLRLPIEQQQPAPETS